MIFFLRRTFVLFAILSVASCATIPEVAYDRTGAGVKKIAFINIGFPEKATAPNVGMSAGNTMASFGLIGALIGGSIEATAQDARQDRLRDSISAQSFDALAFFKSELTVALETEGYEVVFLSAGDRTRSSHELELPTSVMGADAVFDVVTTGYGYLSSGKRWRPYMHTMVMLRDAKTSDVIMQNAVLYNDYLAQGNRISISPTEEYGWANNSDVGTDAEMTVAGLHDAINRSVGAIVTLLR